MHGRGLVGGGLDGCGWMYMDVDVYGCGCMWMYMDVGVCGYIWMGWVGLGWVGLEVLKLAANREKLCFAFFGFVPPYFGVSGSLVYLKRQIMKRSLQIEFASRYPYRLSEARRLE